MPRYRKYYSKDQKREFAIKMDEIRVFCKENGIRYSSNQDSYYYEINGQKYRVSNHTVEQSNRSAINEWGDYSHPVYHPGGREDDVIYILASKTRIIEIYTDLKNGFELDGRGFRKKVR